MGSGEEPVPFHEVGTGTLNTMVLALLTFIAEIKKDNVIFAMEEPEIAMPPHTQRRIANYLLGETTQCFVTSHSPYIIECFQATQIMVLRRDPTGVLSGIQVQLPEGLREKTYRSQLRRVVAEAILGRGVIVVEGITEQRALSAAARKLEETNVDSLPFDLAGLSIVNTDGEGNLSGMGAFFKALGVRAFAFYDKKKHRTPEENQRIQRECEISCETEYKGMESLLVAETPLDCQWAFLEEMRAKEEEHRLQIPATRPADEVIRDVAMAALKRTKGEGGAEVLIEKCAVGQIPVTIRLFLDRVYAQFPRPRRGDTATADAPSASSAPETQSQTEGAGA